MNHRTYTAICGHQQARGAGPLCDACESQATERHVRAKTDRAQSRMIEERKRAEREARDLL